ncbi:MAG: hypothetical protein OXE17_03430 [Chloroflexi bacterium]|nr:hypothetical protein [Chloroflexota bacterium]
MAPVFLRIIRVLPFALITAAVAVACTSTATPDPDLALNETAEVSPPTATVAAPEIMAATPVPTAASTRITPTDVPAPVTKPEVDLESEEQEMPPDPLEKRPAYDTSKPFADLVRPHFYATSEQGELVEVKGSPDAIVILEGRAKIRFAEGEVISYLDPLALESELVGEHPIHKVYRLMEMGIPASEDLMVALESENAGDLFASPEFEYQRRRWSSGVVTDVFLDGTFLVIPTQIPAEWQSNDLRIASPTHLHLNSRALSGGSSPLAREYELEILMLSFEDQRYPPAPLARKQCDVYRESLLADDYAEFLRSVGFRYTPAHAVSGLAEGSAFGARIQALLWEGSGAGVQYFGFEGLWIADVFRQEQVDWLGDCDTTGGLRAYPGAEESSKRHYLTVRRSLEPDKKQRYRIMEVDEAGQATELYVAPGTVLMALPLPFNDRTWLFSTEGWVPAEGSAPADPRWQAVYQVNLDSPDDYVKVRYPIDQFPRAPEAGLYGSSPRMSGEGDFLFNTLYGFTDEGGGIWIVDVSSEDFHASDANFARLVSWDHTLSWMPLGRLESDPQAMHLFMTGKEVSDDFAMTANILRVREDGLNSAVEKSERLLQMVGWNPVPFGWQKLSDTDYRMLVETHYNYESSLMPRAKGVYIIPVSLTEE